MGRMLKFLLITAVMFCLTVLPALAGEPFTVIDARKLQAMLDQKEPATMVIDSRSKPEYDQGHIAGAISLPLAQLTSNPGQLSPQTGKRLVFYCNGAT